MPTLPSAIAYLTDLEGRWDKLESFAADNPHVSLVGHELRLAEGSMLVFGGDAIDRGPHGRRIVRTLLTARRAYGERVVLLAGNRDINKLRLRRELAGEPPASTPPEVAHGPRGALLRWILERTMGAKEAFAHRATELASEGRRAEPDDVAESYLDDLGSGGELRAYLAECQLAFVAQGTLFVHGGVTAENLGIVPGREGRCADVAGWVAGLNGLYQRELDAFAAGREPAALIAYQAPHPGTRWNQESVVYARLTDEHANPVLPADEVLARLRASGIERLVVGHTPSGDCPAIVRDDDFELVLADNSYARLEQGSLVLLTDHGVSVRGTTLLDDGSRAEVRFSTERGSRPSPLGLRDSTSGQLVKSQLASGDYLLFRGLPGYRVEQSAAPASEVAMRPLERARAPDVVRVVTEV